jgi:hypothetical protein
MYLLLRNLQVPLPLLAPTDCQLSDILEAADKVMRLGDRLEDKALLAHG